MKPARFDYVAPTNLDDALSALAAGGGEARALAGGQSLVPMLNFRLGGPATLVDLNAVDELAFVEPTEEGGLRLGAMARQQTLEHDPLVRIRAPLLAEAAPWIAHAQIRSRGTIGGSLAHADPAAELPALLMVLGAQARVARAARGSESGARIERASSLCDLYLGPFFTSLEADEILTEVEIPGLRVGEGTAFAELARRRGDYAIVGVAVRVRLGADGLCEDAAISLINAGPTPCLAEDAAAALLGEVPTPAAIANAAEIASLQCSPAADMHGSVAYRRHLVRVLTNRVLLRARGRARERVV